MTMYQATAYFETAEGEILSLSYGADSQADAEKQADLWVRGANENRAAQIAAGFETIPAEIIGIPAVKVTPKGEPVEPHTAWERTLAELAALKVEASK